MRSFMADIGREVSLTLGIDAAATMGVVRRNGVGRVRHLDVRFFWIQEKVQSGEFHLKTVLGTEKPADLMTKVLGSDQIHASLTSMGIWTAAGRAAIAPTISMACVYLPKMVGTNA